MMVYKYLVLVALAVGLAGCGKSKQEELAALQIKALQDAQVAAAEAQKRKDESTKTITSTDGQNWFSSAKKK